MLNLQELASEYGTPLYVYDAERIGQNSIPKDWKYPHIKILYAMMANPHVAIMEILQEKGLGVQVSSIKELKLAYEAGFAKEDISVATTNLSDTEIHQLSQEDVLLYLDSLEELRTYGNWPDECLSTGQKKREVGLRVYIDSSDYGQTATNAPALSRSRVGIKPEFFDKAKILAAKYGLKIVGLHCYAASNVQDYTKLLDAHRHLIEHAKAFPDLEHLNFGGGFGAQPFDWFRYRDGLIPMVQKLNRFFERDMEIRIEPGRALVAESGILLVRVVNIKDMGDWISVGVNCSFGIFPRPYIYGPETGGYHQIMRVDRHGRPYHGHIEFTGSRSYTICGNSVLQQDIFGIDRLLPPGLKRGDLLAFMQAGAYCSSMMSLFPGQKRPAEVLVDGRKTRVLVEREV